MYVTAVFVFIFNKFSGNERKFKPLHSKLQLAFVDVTILFYYRMYALIVFRLHVKGVISVDA